MKKNYAFIDSQNLHLGVRDSGWDLDLEKFRVYLRDKYKISKAFIFVGYISGNEALYSHFVQCGYHVVFKPTLELNGVIKGNCDAELVLHCMIELKNFGRAVIVSGDGDFHCLIEYLASREKLLKIITPNFRYSSLLRKFAKYILPAPLVKAKISKKGTFPRH